MAVGQGPVPPLVRVCGGASGPPPAVHGCADSSHHASKVEGQWLLFGVFYALRLGFGFGFCILGIGYGVSSSGVWDSAVLSVRGGWGVADLPALCRACVGDSVGERGAGSESWMAEGRSTRCSAAG